MEQQSNSQVSGLENQLRSMILNNVTIGNPQARNQQSNSQGGRGRGRGRGRGLRGAPRGGGRGQYHFDHSQRGHVVGTSNYNPSLRGGDSQNAPTRGHYQAQARSQYHHGTAPAHPSNQPEQGHDNLRSPTFPPPQSNTSNSIHYPRVLPRPQNRGVPQLSVHDSSAPPPRAPHQGYYPPTQYAGPTNQNAQIDHLETLAMREIPKVEMSMVELEEKDSFRRSLEATMQKAFAEQYTGDISTISLAAFGSLASGFGMPGSDMDLAVVPLWKDPSRIEQVEIDRDIPRLLEIAALEAGMGGRLLTKTRVPILKICQNPTQTLYEALVEERKKWDALSEEEKYPVGVPEPEPQLETQHTDVDTSVAVQDRVEFPALGAAVTQATQPTGQNAPKQKKKAPKKAGAKEHAPEPQPIDEPVKTAMQVEEQAAPKSDAQPDKGTEKNNNERQPRPAKAWLREKVIGPLDFPKTGVGIQCDINFGNPLGIHNTHMLRCYSLTDPRVRPMVLFVKSWARRRKINSSYSGTLSSYGWVLMVLHYLVNVARPPVCPNLQHYIPPHSRPTDAVGLEAFFKPVDIAGYNVRFWNAEPEIIAAREAGQLTRNQQPLGALLRGFFQYYAVLNAAGDGRSPTFHWTQEVLSLRTLGGITTKRDKGWVSATTHITAEKKVTNRYLFAIEDPFEHDHNVARTVTHRGIVAIRDEFRRAWRILRAVGQGGVPEGGIFDEVVEEMSESVVSPTPTPTAMNAPVGQQPATKIEAATPATVEAQRAEQEEPQPQQATA